MGEGITSCVLLIDYTQVRRNSKFGQALCSMQLSHAVGLLLTNTQELADEKVRQHSRQCAAPLKYHATELCCLVTHRRTRSTQLLQ